jgi:NADH:ubiquinone oxidoreductase subunit C
MIIEKIEITQHKITLQGELKLVDNELSKENCEEMISRLVSWKLGQLKPIRHFEMVYNKEKMQAEVDVYVTVSIEESSESHIENVRHIFNKLIEFLNLYEREFGAISGKASVSNPKS